MPELIPTVTKNPHIRFPSTWKDPRGKPLTDSAIRQYARKGLYGPDEQRKQQARDKAVIRAGIVMLAQLCQNCKDNKTLGAYMNFSYLPKAGYYCDTCRTHFKDEKENAEQERRKWHSIHAFE